MPSLIKIRNLLSLSLIAVFAGLVSLACGGEATSTPVIVVVTATPGPSAPAAATPTSAPVVEALRYVDGLLVGGPDTPRYGGVLTGLSKSSLAHLDVMQTGSVTVQRLSYRRDSNSPRHRRTV